MGIPKYPEVPYLNDNQIDEMTKIVFCEYNNLVISDMIFVFGSTHPGCYLNALEAYNKKLGNVIFVSGGTSGAPDKHKNWSYGDESEANVIFRKLTEHGVPAEKIYLEYKSTNSKENILYAQRIYDFSKINSILFVCKNYAAGRQYRTLKKYLSENVKIGSFGYNVHLDDGTTFDRYNWMNYDKSRSLVFGEYLRILYYGLIGDIESIDNPIRGLEKYVDKLIKNV